MLLLAGHEAEIVEAHYAAVLRGRTRIVVSRETEPLGTAGALVHARDVLHDRFLLLNGDSLFDFNLLDLVARAPGGRVHMALRDGVVGDLAKDHAGVIIANGRKSLIGWSFG
ncbi:sugar phosphate nucleotidyltransferase [Bradyrhizobium symbiodeficiens]|uniref:sugar phosphate nucleotidyltransferase n=1 Tax=Bradyrhizobium symbiodeficiens TaxID=1404367 RepID=UPI0030D4F26A